MYLAKIIVVHWGCWVTEISRRFPKLRMRTFNNIILSEDLSWDILYAEGDGKEFNEVLNFIRNHKRVKKVELLERSATHLFVHVFTKPSTLVKRILKNKCIVVEATELTNGSEVWSIGAASKENIRNAIESIKEVGDVKLKLMVKWTFETKGLTKKQKKALEIAHSLDYYRWPRKISATEIAKKLKLSKSTFLAHLRKAEAKAIGRYLSGV